MLPNPWQYHFMKRVVLVMLVVICALAPMVGNSQVVIGGLMGVDMEYRAAKAGLCIASKAQLTTTNLWVVDTDNLAILPTASRLYVVGTSNAPVLRIIDAAKPLLSGRLGAVALFDGTSGTRLHSVSLGNVRCPQTDNAALIDIPLNTRDGRTLLNLMLAQTNAFSICIAGIDCENQYKGYMVSVPAMRDVYYQYCRVVK